ncbi:cytochrome c biogenesis CcdA family protein [Lentzea flaviverrucosa]|uniref:Cytochrome c biogenesis protein CcdA n=1 Tax=Lentzea flaviverrucosa TaxID=200379 RepID=A0A1H9JVM5_9PSEU|nr:cytochrome c biogenesis protein CcdA [Lentzea flaviverrucosa]RDI26645.1 cytochrome c biogenesis protein CcdA [Lentzea flaviverrucosa]SEQ90783.1 Cytochrome c biogenesis protein CcdA [Lentzea flaviverrucosa]
MHEFALAVVAGMVATVNPCGFAMLPAYLALVARDSPARAFMSGLVMAAGFVTFFGAFGILVSPVAATLKRYLPFVTVLIGLVMVVVGVLLVLGKDLYLRLPKLQAAPKSLWSMYGYGIAFAIASLSCAIGPFLAVVGASLQTGVMAFFAYALGMGLIVTVLAVAGSALAPHIRKVLPHVGRIGGVVLIAVGAYVTYYGVYELRLFLAGGSAIDPVVRGAGRFQNVLVQLVGALGPWPFVVALAIAGAWWLNRRRRKAVGPGRR